VRTTGLDQIPPELDMSPSTPPGRTYRYLQPDPLYSFGYGLSYGIVSYTNAAVVPTRAKAECKPTPSDCGDVTVCAGETIIVATSFGYAVVSSELLLWSEVRNSKLATHATEEVMQVYAIPSSSVEGASIPKSLLLGFARTSLLQPGDTETVCIPVDLADLRLMGPDAQSFGLLPGTYTITVGGSSPGKSVGAAALAAPLQVELTLEK
jgi:hypothetical protein